MLLEINHRKKTLVINDPRRKIQRREKEVPVRTQILQPQQRTAPNRKLQLEDRNQKGRWKSYDTRRL